MLVVSLRGVNLGFWSHLGCSGQNAIIFSRDRSPWLRRSPLGLHAKKIQKHVYCLCLKWSLLGVKKSLNHAQIGLLYGFNSKFPTSIPTPFTNFFCSVLHRFADKIKFCKWNIAMLIVLREN